MKAIADCSKAIQGVGSRLGEQQIMYLKQIFHVAEDDIEVAPTALDINNDTNQHYLQGCG